MLITSTAYDNHPHPMGNEPVVSTASVLWPYTSSVLSSRRVCGARRPPGHSARKSSRKNLCNTAVISVNIPLILRRTILRWWIEQIKMPVVSDAAQIDVALPRIRRGRKFMIVFLLLLLGFAAYAWFRPLALMRDVGRIALWTGGIHG